MTKTACLRAFFSRYVFTGLYGCAAREERRRIGFGAARIVQCSIWVKRVWLLVRWVWRAGGDAGKGVLEIVRWVWTVLGEEKEKI